MTLALFDLDNTLIAGDSDFLWGEFLERHHLVDPETHRQRNEAFYEDYKEGSLDVAAYLKFALEPLTHYSLAQLDELHNDFMRECIEPIWLPAAEALVEKHRQLGHKLVAITATNRFIVQHIIRRFGIDEIICPEPEIVEGRYTGNFIGVPSYGEGKVTRVLDWLRHNRNESLDDSWFYSDSHNDIPLLERVTNPVVVDGDDALLLHAEKRGWACISLRGS